jgi:hypothetical protein
MRELNNMLCTVALAPVRDKPISKWTKNGKFSVKSMYKNLCSNGLIDLSSISGKQKSL